MTKIKPRMESISIITNSPPHHHPPLRLELIFWTSGPKSNYSTWVPTLIQLFRLLSVKLNSVAAAVLLVKAPVLYFLFVFGQSFMVFIEVKPPVSL